MLGIISLSLSDKKYLKIIKDKEIGYVLLDMQTWLRKEHGIDLWMDSCRENMYHVEDITKNDKYGWSLGTGKPSKDYNEGFVIRTTRSDQINRINLLNKIYFCILAQINY